ncbi:cell division protein FtsQ/DivIB [Paracoccaceae bacterium]|nr:cell division protein FtsQ/DivIB [Paracoccaceae bacterium]
MRSLKRKMRTTIDPAPSIISYRLMRLMLIPRLRLILTLGIPSLIIFCGTLILFLNINVHENIEALKKDLKRALVERPEFMIKVASVDGASDELAHEIREIMPLNFPVSYFDLDIKYLHKVLNDIPAVASAAIKVTVSGVLQINISERIPAFIWRKDDVISVIDEKGEFIRLATSRLDYPELPLVIGEAANLSIADISRLMEDNQYFLDQVRAFVRVGERRWDLVLDNNLRIMLPQAEFLAAFDRLMLMSESGSLFSNQLSSIDMRLVERPTVRVGAASVDRLTYNSSGDL